PQTRMCYFEIRPLPRSTLFPYTTLFRSGGNSPVISMGSARWRDWICTPESMKRRWLLGERRRREAQAGKEREGVAMKSVEAGLRSEEHTSELQSRENLVCRLLLEKKKVR